MKLTSKTEVPYIRGFKNDSKAGEHEQDMNSMFTDEIKVSEPYCVHKPSGISYRLVHVDTPIEREAFEDLMRQTGFSSDYMNNLDWS